MNKLTYDAMCDEVVKKGSAKWVLAGVTLGGTYNQNPAFIIWQSDYALRDEQYVRDLIAKHNAGIM